jgi:hypothetical protein
MPFSFAAFAVDRAPPNEEMVYQKSLDFGIERSANGITVGTILNIFSGDDGAEETLGRTIAFD